MADKYPTLLDSKPEELESLKKFYFEILDDLEATKDELKSVEQDPKLVEEIKKKIQWISDKAETFADEIERVEKDLKDGIPVSVSLTKYSEELKQLEQSVKAKMEELKIAKDELKSTSSRMEKIKDKMKIQWMADQAETYADEIQRLEKDLKDGIHVRLSLARYFKQLEQCSKAKKEDLKMAKNELKLTSVKMENIKGKIIAMDHQLDTWKWEMMRLQRALNEGKTDHAPVAIGPQDPDRKYLNPTFTRAYQVEDTDSGDF